MKKTVIFENATIVKLPYILFYCLSGRKVFSLHRSKSISLFFDKLCIQIIDYQKCKSLDPKLIDVDSRGYGEMVYEEICELQVCNSMLSGFTSIIGGLKQKSKAAILSSIEQRIVSIRNIVAWCEENGSSDFIIVLDFDIYKKILIEKLGYKARHIWSFSLLYKVFKLMANLIPAKISTIISDKGSYLDDLVEGNHVNNIKSSDVGGYKVIYFPHQSINYGVLFSKNQYYSDNVDSPFSPRNILHVEMGNINNNYYDGFSLGVDSIDLYVLSVGFRDRVGKLLKAAKELLPFFVKGVTRKDFFKCCYIGFFIYIKCLISYASILSYVKKCGIFNSAEYALIGFDILFPVECSIALQMSGVKTIATQERYYNAYHNTYPFVFDVYFVPSDCVREKLIASNVHCINDIIIVGLMRLDMLYDFNITNSLQDQVLDRNILVLDFHSEKNYESNRLAPLYGWKSNKLFYEAIYLIAKQFSDYNFVIRGKNNNWVFLEYFNEIKNDLLSLGNVKIHDDYSKIGEQYDVASQSKYIIARHTSMVDECIVAGKIVFIVDYYANNVSYIDELLFDYLGIAYISNNYNNLEKQVRNVLINKTIPDKLKDKEYIKYRFGCYDGKSKQRVKEYLSLL